MDIAQALRHTIAGGSLTAIEAHSVATQIMRGDATAAQIGGLLVALHVKGETIDEIVGFARALREQAVRVPVQADGLVDTCGTGGDGSGTFNISTAAAIAAAAAGCKVAKHGNRASSSKCGSADVLEALGVRIDASAEQVAACLDEIGVAFLFAPLYHQSMKHAAGPRRELGVRSIFNLLGPLANPAGARRQLIGVFDRNLTEPLARVLHELGCEHCLVVSGSDGLDEITTTGPTHVTELRNGQIRRFDLAPADFGVDTARGETLLGGDAQANAAIIEAALTTDEGPPRDIIAVNAGAVLYVAGRATSIAAGVAEALAALRDGRAARTLTQLRKYGCATESVA